MCGIQENGWAFCSGTSVAEPSVLLPKNYM